MHSSTQTVAEPREMGQHRKSGNSYQRLGICAVSFGDREGVNERRNHHHHHYIYTTKPFLAPSHNFLILSDVSLMQIHCRVCQRIFFHYHLWIYCLIYVSGIYMVVLLTIIDKRKSRYGISS